MENQAVIDIKRYEKLIEAEKNIDKIQILNSNSELFKFYDYIGKNEFIEKVTKEIETKQSEINYLEDRNTNLRNSLNDLRTETEKEISRLKKDKCNYNELEEKYNYLKDKLNIASGITKSKALQKYIRNLVNELWQ